MARHRDGNTGTTHDRFIEKALKSRIYAHLHFFNSFTIEIMKTRLRTFGCSVKLNNFFADEIFPEIVYQQMGCPL